MASQKPRIGVELLKAKKPLQARTHLAFRLENGSLLIYSGDAGIVKVSYHTPT